MSRHLIHLLLDCLFKSLVRWTMRNSSKVCINCFFVWGFTREQRFPAQRASNVESVSTSWHHDGLGREEVAYWGLKKNSQKLVPIATTDNLWALLVIRLLSESELTDACICLQDSFTPGGFDYSLKLVNFKLISTINILSIFCEIDIRWIP